MTFLSPTLLWGLLAVSLPIIIYLFSLRDTKEIEFSTVRFIKELEHETIRKLKIRQWLLILLRTAAIAALVLMLARPVQKGFAPGWMAGEQESRVVIIVDNSASMALKVDQKTNLEKAKESVSVIVKSIEGITQLNIFQTSPPKEIFSGRLTSTGMIPSLLKSVQQSHIEDHLWTFVDSVLKKVQGTEPNHECFILSDFPSAPSTSFREKWNRDNVPWRFYGIKMNELEDNVAIRDIQAVSQIKLPDHLLKLNTKITNNGALEKRNIPVELYLNEERVGQIVSHFQPKRTKDFLFQVYPGKSGIVKGILEIPSDDFSLDNILSFELAIPEQIACKVISRSQDDVFLLRTALESISGKSQFLNVEMRTQPEINQLYLDDTDVLILHDPGLLSDDAAESIKKFLADGGGVIWFYGETAKEFSGLAVENNLRLPMYLETITLGGESFYSTVIQNREHGVLKDLNLRDLEKEMPQVFSYNKMKSRRNHNIILALNNGDPFLIEQSLTSGTIYAFTSPVSSEWNDLPMRGLMVPLLHRLLILLATDENNTDGIIAGHTKTIQVSKEKINAQWTLKTPYGQSILVVPDFTSEVLNITETRELGSYNLFADGELYTAFSTRLSPRERPSLRSSNKDLNSGLGEPKSRIIQANETLGDSLKTIRHGKSLWRIFLMVVIILLVLETIIGRPQPGGMRRLDT